MNIWLISAFEPTPYDKSFSARFISIAEECRKRGHQVVFFSSTFKHSTKSQRFQETKELDIDPGYRLKFVKTPDYKSNISFKRLYSHRRFSENLMNEIKKEEKLPDAVFMAYPPISSVLNVSRWAKKNNIPYIVDIIDPWPDDFRKVMKWAPEHIQNILLRPFSVKTKEILREASGISGIAKQRLIWAKKFAPKTNNFQFFYPSADLEEVQKKLKEHEKRIEKDGKLRIIYAGSFASSYDLPTILGAAKILSKEYTGKIEFVLAGAGPQENIVNTYINEFDNLRYIGRVSKEKLMEEYFKADLGLIQHFPDATQTVTYKLFDLLSCGIPILNSLESELNDILIENQVGFFNKSGDSSQLAKNILYCFDNPGELKKLKERAIEVTSKIGDTKNVYASVVKMIEEVSLNNTVPIQ